MEKPYASITRQRLAAPFEDMEEIAIAALNSMQFRNFTFIESIKTIQATREDTEVWANHPFKRAYAIEIGWLEDPEPPAEFQQLYADNEHIQPLLVSVKLKDMKSDAADGVKQMIIAFWKQLKERAKQTSEAAKTRKALTEHGAARWATVEELEKEGYIQEASSENSSTRLLIGTYKNKTVSVPRQFTEAHAIVAGPPGVGKSRTIFIPNLIERLETSAIVTEVVAGEQITPVVYRMTSGFRASKGQKVFYINPSDLDNSTRFNPIDFIEGIDDAIYYADLIITNTTEKSHVGDQIWKQSETHLLTALLLYAWGLGGKKRSVEGGLANLGHMRSLLRYGPITLNKLIKSNGIRESQDRFDEFVRNSSPNFRLGVFSGLIQRLNPWLNPKLIKLTEVSDFSKDELRKSLFTFYLAYPVHRQDYKPIMSLALNFLTKLALRQSFDKPLTLLLDEFAAYGNIPGIDTLLATIRNSGIGIVLGFQDQQQLQKNYSANEAEVLCTINETKVFFATGSGRTQQQVSQLLGKATRMKKQVSSTGHITRQTYGAPLMEPGEIGTGIKQGEVLMIRNKRNPVIVKTCDPGKYNKYEQLYPVLKKPKKLTDPKIFDNVREAEELMFSQEIADAQTSLYEKVWREKMEAEEKLAQARQQNISPAKIKTLEAELVRACRTYDKFVSPEPEPAMKEEAEDERTFAKPPKPVPTISKPNHADVKPTEQTASAPAAAAAAPKNVEQESQKKSQQESVPEQKESPKRSVQESDPYAKWYSDDTDDPYNGFYADD